MIYGPSMPWNRDARRTWPLGVVFDLDGVLVDSARTHLAAYLTAFENAGTPWPASATEMVLAGAARTQVIAHAAGHLSVELQTALAQAKGQHVLAALAGGDVVAIPGALEFARRARSKGLRLAVASNSKAAPAFLHQLGATELFEHVVVSSDALRPKPAPDLYMAAVKALGLRAEDCVAIEDATPGVVAAHAAGVPVVRFGAADDTGLAQAVFPTMDFIAAWVFNEGTEKSL